ncbi:39S ribosomal protein L19, mitochondrial-like [Branchiostoma floridae]|uniref:Large ribosomal subunit protein bL19m n=1 Tax=Branchiostoma floridae TaxID=7739 RepID=A0A9J7MYG9_BRAFL|nr:39S ribosomal protein L19, mitochondrial-like [Branchiostoma floridae]
MAAFGRVLLRSRQNLCLRWSSSTVEAAKPAAAASPDITELTQGQKNKTQRFISPEFIIPRGMKADFPTKNHMERMDMLRRRSVIDIPEFYVGSILSVLTADPYAPGKYQQFVGICIKRGGYGLGATFTLRNIVNGQGIEICYELYNPTIHQVQVLKLQKSVDPHMVYLRDALPEYSTIDFNLEPVQHNPEDPVPILDTKVILKPPPWYWRWERVELQGINREHMRENHLSQKRLDKMDKHRKPWMEFDLMYEYDTTQVEQDVLKDMQYFENAVRRKKETAEKADEEEKT